jgi:hypothetical protein
VEKLFNNAEAITKSLTSWDCCWFQQFMSISAIVSAIYDEEVTELLAASLVA